MSNSLIAGEHSPPRNPRSKWLQTAGETATILFALAMFLGKAATNITGALLFAIWLCHVIDRRFHFKNCAPYLKWVVIPLMLGLVINALSPAGPSSTGQYLNHFKFMLLPLVLTSFITTQRRMILVLCCILVSALFSLGVALVTHQGQLFGFLHGFQRPGRCADALMTVSLVLLVLVFTPKERCPGIYRPIRWAMAGLFLFFFWAMIMTAIRGAWIGFCLGAAFFFIRFRPRLVPVMVVAVMVSMLFVSQFKPFLYFQIKTELYSIATVFADVPADSISPPAAPEGISRVNTPPYESNEVRKHILVTGIDFAKQHLLTGTGIKNTEQLFLTFLSRQPRDYQKRFHHAKVHPRDFHNSYLQLLIEAGIITTGLVMAGIVILLVELARYIPHCPGVSGTFMTAALIACIGFGTAQMFHTDLFSYGGKFFFFTLFMGRFYLSCCNRSRAFS